jgi:hypothetical protein
VRLEILALLDRKDLLVLEFYQLVRLLNLRGQPRQLNSFYAKVNP